MNPPWIEFPQIRLGSLGWRMGASEDYWYAFMDWFTALSKAQQSDFEQKWPAPQGWAGYYERLIVQAERRIR